MRPDGPPGTSHAKKNRYSSGRRDGSFAFGGAGVTTAAETVLALAPRLLLLTTAAVAVGGTFVIVGAVGEGIGDCFSS